MTNASCVFMGGANAKIGDAGDAGVVTNLTHPWFEPLLSWVGQLPNWLLIFVAFVYISILLAALLLRLGAFFWRSASLYYSYYNYLAVKRPADSRQR